MENLISSLKDISIEVLINSVLVFILTMILKLPIKRLTNKLSEDKRKAVNSIIIIIPIILSYGISIIYFGVKQNNWFDSKVLDLGFSSYIVSVSLYTLFERCSYIIKSIKEQGIDKNLDKSTVDFLKQNIKALLKCIKVDEKTLNSLNTQIKQCFEIKQKLLDNNENEKELVETIINLKQQEQKLQSQINSNKQKINEYQSKLKGETNEKN
jgi:hypothetical protein